MGLCMKIRSGESGRSGGRRTLLPLYLSLDFVYVWVEVSYSLSLSAPSPELDLLVSFGSLSLVSLG